MPKPSPTAEDIAPGGGEAEAKAAFHLRLRARGVRNRSVLRAFEVVSRARFVPERYVALAARDLPLPIACGQTTHEPWRYALAVEALGVEPAHRVLEIGSGSGYVTAVLAQLAGEVLSLERWARLAEAAQARLSGLEVGNAIVAWGDGLAVSAEAGSFDRILVHAAVCERVDLTVLLAPGGRLVAGRGGDLVAWGGGESRIIGACPYPTLVGGLAGGSLSLCAGGMRALPSR